ncbi:pyruvate dehydrogenase complex dihydrolipoamide acetyltransferase [Oleispirillum naphthae]|uniref:pyruvate dehydrogenase complex dihydrolipoamide acetyltransferase n=1 Tax=Oleispirillum naphthae TaxID=2838853 RepID=UPI0030823A40
MPIEILMPALSPTMTEGTLAKWNVKEGDAVSSGDVLAEIETDKATMELEAVDEGVIGKILIPAGTAGVAVNTPIALLLEEGEDASALAAVPAKPAPAPQPEAAAKPQAEAKPAASPLPDLGSLGLGALGGAPAPQAAKPAGERVFASPLARRIAAEAKLDLSRIAGSGPRGRIVKADVEAAKARGGEEEIDDDLAAAMAFALAVKAPEPAAKPQAAAAPAADYGTPFTETPHSTIRKVIARRLSESKQTVPHFYITMEVMLDELLALRKKINGQEGAAKVSVNDFVIRACAVALKRMPEANVSWTGEAMRAYSRSDVSVAVATPTGLITPIVRGAESKSLGTISEEMRGLAARAREGKLMPEEYQGGTFSISNLGMYGVREFAAIINPPQSMLLAVGAGEQRPVVKDGALAVGTVMSLTLSADHRCIDGALGAQFLGLVKNLLENPLSILL